MSALERCRHFGVTNIRGVACMPSPVEQQQQKKGNYGSVAEAWRPKQLRGQLWFDPLSSCK